MSVVGLTLALLLAATAPAFAAAEPARGLVLVSVDTLRADHIRAYGGPIHTPAFDAVAERGVLLEQAYTPTPTTGPAHASLMTGLHPWRHGVLDNAVPLPGDPALCGQTLYFQSLHVEPGGGFASSPRLGVTVQ